MNALDRVNHFWVEVILCIFVLLLFVNGIDENLFIKNDVEKIQTYQRSEYFSKELGIFYRRPPIKYYLSDFEVVATKYFAKIRRSFDLENYFSSKLSYLLIPLIFLGGYNYLKNIGKEQLILVIILIFLLGFTKSTDLFGVSVFYLPVAYFSILGSLRIWKIKKIYI